MFFCLCFYGILFPQKMLVFNLFHGFHIVSLKPHRCERVSGELTAIGFDICRMKREPSFRPIPLILYLFFPRRANNPSDLAKSSFEVSPNLQHFKRIFRNLSTLEGKRGIFANSKLANSNR